MNEEMKKHLATHKRLIERNKARRNAAKSKGKLVAEHK